MFDGPNGSMRLAAGLGHTDDGIAVAWYSEKNGRLFANETMGHRN